MDRFDMQCSIVAFETKKSPTGQMLKSCVPKGDPFDQEVTALFEEMIEEYLDGDIEEQSLHGSLIVIGRAGLPGISIQSRGSRATAIFI